MLKRTLVSVFVLCLATSGVLWADSTDLQVVGANISGNQVSVTVDNPNASPETARVLVSVRLVDGTTPTLVTSTVTVNGGATSTVSVISTQEILEIVEDPQPISPVN